MQFIDKVKVSLKAGDGGNGAVSFRHEIYIPKGGPDGGNGGKGGDIVFRADKNTDSLLDLRFTPELSAENGENGSGTRSSGRSGKDLIVDVPVGTICKKNNTIVADLTSDGQTAIVAHGGEGGFGNAHFKSSVRQAPIIAEVGEPGEAYEAEIELKILADVGLVGLPNAGKSTFLSVVTNARPEIADYPFTTITPNLGVATIDKHDFLIADIPGLVEGASEGRGLGHDFLRHVDRTSVLLHLIDSYSDDAGSAYKTIRAELDKYSDLKNRPEVIALTKCEGLDPEILEMQQNSIKKINKNANIFIISSVAHQGLTPLLRELWSKIAQNRNKNRDENLNENCDKAPDAPQPIISLSSSDYRDTFSITMDGDIFVVAGEKIEKFARRTDMSNYASVNRLRDIMKKLGIRAELTSMGATAESIIRISGKEFTLVEDW